MDPRYKSPTANVDIDMEGAFRDIEQFTNVLKWMLRVGALIAAFGLLSSWAQINLLSGTYTPEQGNANDVRESAVNGLTLFFKFTTYFVFGRWIVLAHRNLPALGARYLDVTPGWAVGWFFVPVVNLWFPYRAMRLLWQNSHSTQRPGLQDSGWVLPVWWGLWLAAAYSPVFIWLAMNRANTVAGLIVLTEWQIANRLMVFGLYIVAAVLVSRIWEAQRVQHDTPGAFDPAPEFADH